LPFGTYRLSPGDQLFHFAPINTIDRGLYFDGDSGHVKISGIILNSNFSVHFWAYFFSFQGDLVAIESETPSTDNEEQAMTCSCGGSQDNAEEAEVGVNWNGGANVVSASGELPIRQWVDFNLIVKYNLADQSTDITFCLGEFTLELTATGNPFHHKKDTDIKFCAGCDAFVLNFKLFNQPIPKSEVEGLRFDFEFPFEQPVCTIGQFFFGDRCSDCEGCSVCSDSATNCVDACFDSECASCDDSSEGSACHDCGLNGRA
jgi:hypothetical protein